MSTFSDYLERCKGLYQEGFNSSEGGLISFERINIFKRDESNDYRPVLRRKRHRARGKKRKSSIDSEIQDSVVLRGLVTEYRSKNVDCESDSFGDYYIAKGNVAPEESITGKYLNIENYEIKRSVNKTQYNYLDKKRIEMLLERERLVQDVEDSDNISDFSLIS